MARLQQPDITLPTPWPALAQASMPLHVPGMATGDGLLLAVMETESPAGPGQCAGYRGPPPHLGGRQRHALCTQVGKPMSSRKSISISLGFAACSCTCWQKRDFLSPCTCRTSAAFEALPYLPFLRPVGRRASHASQTKGCLGGMDSPLQRGASSALLQHIPDPETGLTLQPTGSFAAWKPHAPPSLSTPGSGCAWGRCGALGAPSGSTSGRGSVLP